MRILFDSKNILHKDPFGTLIPGQLCTLRVHVPTREDPINMRCLFTDEKGAVVQSVAMPPVEQQGDYTVFSGTFSLSQTGLYFYYFEVFKPGSSFRLFKAGDSTNMEAGDLWQVSCVPQDFTVPDWAKGAVIYQVFPDRFCKSGECDLSGKLRPYVVHEGWEEEVFWQPNENGEVLNNDFYGGNFRGITDKLPYIASLGVTVLYLNPISKSFSSHRYDTGDYKTPDPMLGTAEDFRLLCEKAHSLDIRVVLDGVFSHTGSNSLYFDKENTFGGSGAYCSPDSPYYSWYTFHKYPDKYDSWWGFDTLPTVKKLDPGFVEYIITAPDSVIAHWLKLGADGFRLDVADELPNEFLQLLKKKLREIKPDALLIGEVWEDASNKSAYGIRKRYFVDGVLDSCMNYPFRTAILNLLLGNDDGQGLRSTVMTVLENYPAQVAGCNMNLLGTHDTPRILTALADPFDGARQELAKRRLCEAALQKAKQQLLCASVLQFCLPGASSIYYGDEVGMEGHKDPFNRRTFPWGREDTRLLGHFRALGMLKKTHPAFKGSTEFFCSEGGRIGIFRNFEGKALKIYVNCSSTPWEIAPGKILLTNKAASDSRSLPPLCFCIEEL